MALTRTLTELTYRSEAGGQIYTFVISMDQLGNISVREILTPTGGLCSSTALLPESVLQDIETAICQLRGLLRQTSVVSGNLTFHNSTEEVVTFSSPFTNSDDYRVVFSTADFLSVRVANKTTTGFTVDAGITYNGEIGYDVLIEDSSDASGIESFSAETSKAITFDTLFPNTDYRVFTSVEEFIAVRAVNKTVAGFDLETDITYTGDVGYDVKYPNTAGTLTFTAEASKAVVFPKPFNCDKYRVAFSVADFIAVRAISKSRAGFTVEVDVTYTGDIGYEVFV